MEDATYVRRDTRRAASSATPGTSSIRAAAPSLDPSEAFALGNPHVYFRNNAGNATVSRVLLEALGRHGRGHTAALLQTALGLFQSHSGVPLREVPHRAGFYSRARAERVWGEAPQFRWAPPAAPVPV